MIQRVIRQLGNYSLDAAIMVAANVSQHDSVIAQIGDTVNIVTEPSCCDTFPAICFVCEFLAKEKVCSKDEVVVVMLCDPYTDNGYFAAISRMAKAIERDLSDIMVMGIEPTYPPQNSDTLSRESSHKAQIRYASIGLRRSLIPLMLKLSLLTRFFGMAVFRFPTQRPYRYCRSILRSATTLPTMTVSQR